MAGAVVQGESDDLGIAMTSLTCHSCAGGNHQHFCSLTFMENRRCGGKEKGRMQSEVSTVD